MVEGLVKNSTESVQEDRSLRNSESIASTTNERMKMLDIIRDKPIKITVKVVVPVRDHPKFNFVGKLLGPKGNSLKRLQEDTMCKMAVLGRGSMKDRKKEEELRACGEPRYAHFAEDLHVEISTFASPAEAHARIAYALAEVRRFLVPDYHDDIRQEQMWEMQALSSSSSSSQTQTGEQNSPNSITDTERCPDHQMDFNENIPMALDCLPSITTPNIIPSSLDGTTISDSNIQASTISTTKNNNYINNNNNNNNSNNNDNNIAKYVNNLITNNDTDKTNETTFSSALHLDLSTHTVHPSTVAAAIHHQLVTAGMGIIKPATGMTTVTGLIPNQTRFCIPNEHGRTTPTTLTLLEQPNTILHPALRGVQTVNIVPLNNFQIANGLRRKRPLLGVPRSSMNPTKRTVMTLLGRAKNSKTLHSFRNAGASGISQPFQIIPSPLIKTSSIESSTI